MLGTHSADRPDGCDACCCQRPQLAFHLGYEYAVGACRSALDAGLRRGVISPSRARRTSCASHALHRVCASVMPFTGYARQSCPSPGMRVSHAPHRVCSSVMPLTGYARQSCPSPGMRVSHALHKGMRVSHALHKGMRVSHALHRVCSSVMLPAFPSSQTQLLRSSSAPMRRSAGAARGNVTAMRRPAGLGSTICLATTRCKSPGKSTGSSA